MAKTHRCQTGKSAPQPSGRGADAGEHAEREATKVIFDESMVYYASLLMDLYEEPVHVIGIWHKHNHNYNPPFSEEDNLVHQRLVEQTENDILSILFQKEPEGSYVMKVFRYNRKGQLSLEDFEVEELSNMAQYRNLYE